MLVVYLSADAIAATLDVPGTYATIGEAYGAATVGDEIVVAPGTYTESLVLSRMITIRGDGEGVIWTGPGPLVDVESAEVALEGLTLAPESGRALVANAADLTLTDVVI